MELGTPDLEPRRTLPSLGELTGAMNLTRLDSDSTQNLTPEARSGRGEGRRTKFTAKPEVRGKKKMVRTKGRTNSAPAESPASRRFQNTAGTVHHIFPLAGERGWVGLATGVN